MNVPVNCFDSLFRIIAVFDIAFLDTCKLQAVSAFKRDKLSLPCLCPVPCAEFQGWFSDIVVIVDHIIRIKPSLESHPPYLDFLSRAPFLTDIVDDRVHLSRDILKCIIGPPPAGYFVD